MEPHQNQFYLAFSRLISLGECFWFVSIGKNIFKAYSRTLIHPRFPPACQRLYIFLHHIIGSIFFFFEFIVLACKRCLKVGLMLSSVRLNTVHQYFSNPNMVITRQDILMFSFMTYAIVFLINICDFVVHQFVISLQTYKGIILELRLFERKNSIFRRFLIWLSFYFQ